MINKQFKKVSNNITALVILASVVSVVILSVSLYQFNAVRLDDSNIEEIQLLTSDNTAVSAYLDEQKASEAHFITISNLIKEDQQKAVSKAVVWSTLPVLVIVSLIGWLVSKQILKPVKESYESQERFMQDAAHELRNPLAAMNLAIENSSSTEAEQSGLLKTMKRQTKRLIKINEDLLYLDRRQAGDDIQEINISDLLEDILEDFQPAIKHKKLKLTKTIQSDVYYRIDPKDFVKLTRNIIENAIKYTNPNKEIKIDLSGGKKITLTVQDQGIGIPKDDIQHIGERFFRCNNVGKISGTGLGVAIVKKVLNSYGGILDIKSNQGEGTVVTITI